METANVLIRYLTAIGGTVVAYSTCIFLMTIPFVQRHIFYLHKLPIWWRQKLDVPESFGFLHNQVLPLHIPTSDGETLYAWLIVPLALYLKNEQQFVSNKSTTDGKQLALQLLRHHQSRLVIYFHGNAGSVAQTRRTDAYRLISASSENAFVLTFDYRGFAKSTGSPSEAGLITDALSIIGWATDVGEVPTDRIVLLSQSLGTAVATAAVDCLTRDGSSSKFAGLVLCAAFTDTFSAIASFKICGIPLLRLITANPKLRTWLASKVRDTWHTKERLSHIISNAGCSSVVLIADVHDQVISFANTVDLFNSIAFQVDIGTQRIANNRLVDLGQGGSTKECRRGTTMIRQVLLENGGVLSTKRVRCTHLTSTGHNGIMKWCPVAAEVYKIIDSC